MEEEVQLEVMGELVSSGLNSSVRTMMLRENGVRIRKQCAAELQAGGKPTSTWALRSALATGHSGVSFLNPPVTQQVPLFGTTAADVATRGVGCHIRPVNRGGASDLQPISSFRNFRQGWRE